MNKGKKRKIIGLAVIAGAIMITLLLTYYICMPLLEMSDNPIEFRSYMEERGILGIMSFIIALILQVVVAIIPGGPFQIAAGFAFGTIKGAIIVDIGNTIGSLFAFIFVRKFGVEFIEMFFSKEKIDSIRFLKTTKQRELVLFLLFLIPGTPKDILSYGVGLTDIRLRDWLFIVAVGRFPGIFMSAYGGNAIGEADYLRFAVVILIIMLLAVIGSGLYIRWSHRQNENSDENGNMG